MATIVIKGTLEVSINGQSYAGLTCPMEWSVNCCSQNGTYGFVWGGGGIGICFGDDCNSPTLEKVEQTFCDPCVNRCNKDGNQLKYSGSQQWLFNTYVNRSPTPAGILIQTFQVQGGVSATGPSAGRCGEGKLSVNGQSVCCNTDDIEYVDLGKKSIDIVQLLKAQSQQYITVPAGDDPKEVCDCYCPGCGPSIYGWCGQDLGMILNLMRESESQKCS